ncbi:polysaccharide deacetylase family protein [Dethiobacter alkaliphilus]|uniref:polysaccharide deacetylase family protein n=1 Tax=Dethiobacter alkaliphilus TaxID=427926 RepID=UPI002227BE6E|nr:polysaccharide deacetylase family protein [Dethiobacter alkaliphilus]MCW3490189.1 polysaccharide deacetylase [Dethiobacter alkaliphilus]
MDNTFSYFYPQDKGTKKKSVEKKEKTAASSGKTAYLSFDDGPSEQTARILDVLKRYGIKGTFFVIGKDTEFGRRMYKRIVDEGHQIGNHSYSHDYDKIYKSVDSFVNDFMKLERLLESAAGQRPRIMRYPGGSNNTVSHRAGGAGIMGDIIAEMTRRGYIHFDWNVDAGDAASAINSADLILSNVLDQAAQKRNALILLHDAGYQKHTPAVLPQIIEGLQSQGFGFSVLSQSSYRVQFVK